MDNKRRVTLLKMLIGVARRYPCVLGDEMTAPTRGTNILTYIESWFDIGIFNKYKPRGRQYSAKNFGHRHSRDFRIAFLRSDYILSSVNIVSDLNCLLRK